MSNFNFLEKEYKELYDVCSEMENNYFTSPRTVCIFGRLAVETVIKYIYKFNCWNIPGDGSIKVLMTTKDFYSEFEEVDREKFHIVRKLGNLAVHNISTKITKEDSIKVTNIVFNLATWFSHCYGELDKELTFSEELIPTFRPIENTKLATEKAESIEEQIKTKVNTIALETSSKKEDIKFTDNSTTEEETRRWYIDTMLKAAGWNFIDGSVKEEFPVSGMPIEDNPTGLGFVDYVLFGDNGLPLAVVEAKKTARDPREGRHQAILYANCLEKQFGQRPIVFYSNGYSTYILNDYNNEPERKIFGFYRKDELMTLIQRRSLREPLASALSKIDRNIINRVYQQTGVTKAIETFYENRRKALLVMATGSGKTRTAIALVKALMESQNVKRVLFLADRVNLVEQARDNFATLYPSTTTANVLDKVSDEARDLNARIIFSTYQSMMGLIEQKRADGTDLFGVGHFDLIIVDESHRSLYNKFGILFEYFDSMLLGLTATPKRELGINTFKTFELPNDEPTHSYDLYEAIGDQYLVPPKAISIDLKLPNEGIVYDELSPEEQEHFEDLFEDEDGNLPDVIDGIQINEHIKNKDTVRTMLHKLMTNGLKVENGDKLGKTIIFTNRDENAEHIVEIFNKEYPHLGQDFCVKITNKVEKKKSLFAQFKTKDKYPQIAVSVDMLDTGVDVPEILNLVFFRKVMSKSKFWQMVGRGTRLCPNVFGQGQDKKEFLIFDYFGNIEFFRAQDEIPEGEEKTFESMTQRIFNRQIALLQNLQHMDYQRDEEIKAFYESLLDKIFENINSIDKNSVYYRKEKEYIIKYSAKKELMTLNENKIEEIKRHISYIPFPLLFDNTSAKWFDSMILNLQLSKFEKMNTNLEIKRCVKIGNTLKEFGTIPKIKENYDKIVILADSERLQHEDILGLEAIRIAIRDLLDLLPKVQREPIYSDFKETVIKEQEEDMSFGMYEYKSSKPKLREFLLNHENDLVIKKLRNNIAIDSEDFENLENLLFKSELPLTISDLENEDNEVSKEYKKLKSMYGGTPLTYFVRSLVGLEKDAVNIAFAEFIGSHSFTGVQIDLIDMIKNNYIENGIFNPHDLVGDKVKAISPTGIMVFDMKEIGELKNIIDSINDSAKV